MDKNILAELNNTNAPHKIKELFQIESNALLINELFEIIEYGLTNGIIKNKSLNYIMNSANCILSIINMNFILNKKEVKEKVNKYLKIIEEINFDKLTDKNFTCIIKTKKYLLKILNNNELTEKNNDLSKALMILFKHTTNINDIKSLFLKYPDMRDLKEMYEVSFMYELIDSFVKTVSNNNNDKIQYYISLFNYLFSYDFENKLYVQDKLIKKIDIIIEEYGHYLKEEQKKSINHLKKIINQDAFQLDNLFVKKDYLYEEKEPQKILDFTNKNVFTIDSKDAMCLDDAISFERLKNGNYLLCVYIADVNRYVQENSPIEKRAYNLGQTLYLQDTYVPMFPDDLAFNICSLKAGNIKYCNVFQLLFDSNFDLINVKAENAKIIVNNNYTTEYVTSQIKKGTNFVDLYNCTSKLIEDKKAISDYHSIKESLNPYKSECEKYSKQFGNLLVSNIKIYLNNYIASLFYLNELPFIYRNNLKTNVTDVIKLIEDNNINPKVVTYFNSLKGTFLKSKYSSTNEGHCGLNLDAYGHTTTPIRNYSSYFNQKLFQKFFINKDFTDKDVYNYERLVAIIANYLNERAELVDELNSKKIKILKKC